ncbi:MAG TPA: ATP-binding protein [Kofleriaceae bacterium]|nr:ATP-binding protein [Kofleriaceae bacterium]
MTALERAMGTDRFARAVAVRLAALFATMVAVVYLAARTELPVATALTGGLALAQAALLVHYVHRTNRELVRLLGAIRYDDFQQSFTIEELGPTFADLKGAFDEVIGRFRAARLDREAQRRYLEALVEHVPVGILALHEDGAVELLNSAARRLLDAAAPTRIDALVAYGAGFQRDLVQSHPGDRLLTRIELDGVQRHVVLSATRLTITGQAIKLVTLQDIQSELDWNELSAWQDMAQVLSHEIMNSLTPIASLARTADDLVGQLADRERPRDGAAPGGGGDDEDADDDDADDDDADDEHEELVADLRAAIQTLARRSDSLMRFVRNYRQFTQLPPPSLRPLPLRDYFARLEPLLAAEHRPRGVDLHVTLPAAGLTITADDALLDQAIINLVRNAADAATSRPAAGQRPQVWLDARLSDRGHPVIEIGDNGPGVDDTLGDRIYLPFFTTKPEGSGIGLALARQVMLVHKGAITAGTRPGGGALFRLTF